MLYINTIIVEGADSGPSLPSGADQGSIKSIEDMRVFLEEMYMVCLLNPNDQTGNIPNTNSYKISILGTYLWPLLGPYTEWSLDELSPLFGTPTNPTSMVQKSAAQSSGKPPPVPIIAGDEDYALFLQLAILGSMIMPFSTYPYNNGHSVTIWYKIIGGKKNGHVRDYYNYGRNDSWGQTIYLSNTYLSEITQILAHFHGQTTAATKSYPGDSKYTELY